MPILLEEKGKIMTAVIKNKSTRQNTIKCHVKTKQKRMVNLNKYIF